MLNKGRCRFGGCDDEPNSPKLQHFTDASYKEENFDISQNTFSFTKKTLKRHLPRSTARVVVWRCSLFETALNSNIFFSFSKDLNLSMIFFFSLSLFLFVTSGFFLTPACILCCCWDKLLTESIQECLRHLTMKGKRKSRISYLNLPFLPLTILFTRWTRENLPPRCRENVFLSSVTVGYWAKPWLMRRSTVDKPRLTFDCADVYNCV